MGTLNKSVNRAKSWFTKIKNTIIQQHIEPPKIDLEKFKGNKSLVRAKSPWWVVLYHSKSRPKLTRLQPLKEFGTFKKRKPIYGLER